MKLLANTNFETAHIPTTHRVGNKPSYYLSKYSVNFAPCRYCFVSQRGIKMPVHGFSCYGQASGVHRTRDSPRGIVNKSRAVKVS